MLPYMVKEIFLSTIKLRILRREIILDYLCGSYAIIILLTREEGNMMTGAELE